MYFYYFKLALLSLRKTPLLTLLMVAMIAIGIGATMTTYTISYMMSKDPIPNKSANLYQVQLDSMNYEFADGDILPITISYQDVQALLKSDIPKNHVALSAIQAEISPINNEEREPRSLEVRSTTSDFFTMFEVPFLYGGGWSEQDGKDAAQVAVLSKETNAWLFNGENSVGSTFYFGEDTYRVIGVLDDWNPLPKFYALQNEAFKKPNGLFIPFNTQIKNELLTLKLMNSYCWKEPDDQSFAALLASECMWVVFWVELSNEQDRDQYQTFIDNHAKEQQALGRFPRRIFNKLLPLQEYLIVEEIVSDDSKLAVWLAALFLLVCLLNCMSLMIAKFDAKAGEIGLRRAVGARQNDIIKQFAIELSVIGLVGGLLGLVFAKLGLIAAANTYHYLHSGLMQMNSQLLISTVILAVSSSLVFGLYPIIKASQMQPSSQLKSL
ncbi:ABC transporter permease [Pseudoalteromonas citrea]|uniref:ABC transporter permease n=1 Tax=Pseudoalteromonas citrea TaxID=43655 RepID=A0A5S3XJP4_9GAMM|nr:ABC transporter permease [Pseudoalteromonas citrea]TMP41954.1 ABC transporter permease [Pseudoalteromonas citrea]TMP54511.1 ABC transporter permease [Pseudoalteromonas citrea]